MTAVDVRRGTVYRTIARPITRSLAVTGTLAVTQAAFVSLVLVEAVTVLAWVLEPRAGSDSAVALRLGGSVWLTALHTRVHSGGAVVGLPLPGLTVLLAWLLCLSVSRLARGRLDHGDVALTGGQEAVRIALATAVPMALVSAVVAGLSRGPGITPSPRTAALGGFAVGAAGGLWGLRRVWRELDDRPLIDRLPAGAALTLRTAGAVVVALLSLGALLVAVNLVRHQSTALDLERALGAGVLGGFVLLLLGIALVPTAAVLGVSWLAGPGFALGTGTTVSPNGTTVGAVPGLPLLAALPGGRHGPGLTVVLIVVGVGLICGLLMSGWLGLDETATVGTAVRSGAWAGLLAALMLGLLAAFVGGPAGSGPMLSVGPSAWRVTVALVVELGAGCALGAVMRLLADREA